MRMLALERERDLNEERNCHRDIEFTRDEERAELVTRAGQLQNETLPMAHHRMPLSNLHTQSTHPHPCLCPWPV